MSDGRVGAKDQSIWSKMSQKAAKTVGGKIQSSGADAKANTHKNGEADSFLKGAAGTSSRAAPATQPPSPTGPNRASSASAVKGVQAGQLPKFYTAARDGDLMALRKEVYAGAPINARVGDGSEPTALFAAAMGDHHDCAIFLLQQGANTEILADESNLRWTVLMQCIALRDPINPTIKALLEASADVHARCLPNDTPLKKAQEIAKDPTPGRLAMVELLKLYAE